MRARWNSAPLIRLGPVEASADLKRARCKVARNPLHLQKDRPNKETECHEQRNRIAGAAEERCVADPAKCCGLAGPDRYFPDVQFAQLAHRRFNVILFADRNAAAGEHEVRFQRAACQRLQGGGKGVLDGPDIDNLAAKVLQQSRERHAI